MRDYFEDFFLGLKWLCWSISGIFQSETFSSSTTDEVYTTDKKYNGWIESVRSERERE